jgi:two-component system LytT family response regulator
MNLGEREQRARTLLYELKHLPRYLDWLLVHDRRRLLLIKVDEIAWLEAQGNYVRIYHDRGSHLIRESLSTIESHLDPKRFLRIHRSVVVGLKRIVELRPSQHSDYRVLLDNGTQLIWSRTYRANLDKAVNREP